jgi:hypothetical protein
MALQPQRSPVKGADRPELRTRADTGAHGVSAPA